MQNKINIYNFFGLDNFDIELSKINIFSGRNNTGKSLLIEEISEYLYNDIYDLDDSSYIYPSFIKKDEEMCDKIYKTLVDILGYDIDYNEYLYLLNGDTLLANNSVNNLIVLLYSIFDANKGSHFIIKYPERFLHPISQHILGKFISKAATQNDFIFIIETYSYDFLSGIILDMAESQKGDDGLICYFLEHNKIPKKITLKNYALYPLPDGFMDSIQQYVSNMIKIKFKLNDDLNVSI